MHTRWCEEMVAVQPPNLTPVIAYRESLGSDPSAAGGGYSEGSDGQRSKFRERSASWKFWAPQPDTGTREAHNKIPHLPV